MRIIFVRHGEPDYENDCLTENGLIQAEKTALRLKNEKISAIYASPMGRAMATASFTAADQGLTIQPLDFMHEINWGKKGDTSLDYGGHPWSLAYDLITETSGYAERDQWRDHPFFRDNICMDYYDRISRETDQFLKTYGLVREGKIYRSARPCSDTIAIFAHGGSGAIFISHLLGLSFPFVLTAMPYGVCSVSIFSLEALKEDWIIPRIELFNDMGHLDHVRKEALRFER